MEMNKPIIYVMLGQPENGRTAGFFTNGSMKDMYAFNSLEEMLEQAVPLVADRFFSVPPASGPVYEKAEKPKFKRLFVLEILFQQYGDWQGYVRGIKGVTAKIFRRRAELLSILEKETGCMEKKQMMSECR